MAGRLMQCGDTGRSCGFKRARPTAYLGLTRFRDIHMCKVRCGWYEHDSRQRYYEIYRRSNSGIGIKQIGVQAWPPLATFLDRISDIQLNRGDQKR